MSGSQMHIPSGRKSILAGAMSCLITMSSTSIFWFVLFPLVQESVSVGFRRVTFPAFFSRSHLRCFELSAFGSLFELGTNVNMTPLVVSTSSSRESFASFPSEMLRSTFRFFFGRSRGESGFDACEIGNRAWRRESDEYLNLEH